MNKLFTKIAGVSLAIAMMIGVGVGVASSNKEAIPAYAITAPYSVSLDNHASGNNNAHITSASQASFTYDGVTWSHSATWGNNGTYIGTAKTVAQWGSKKKPADTVTLSTTGFANKVIQNVTVNGYCSNFTGPKVSASAGGTAIFTNVAMVQTTATNYTANEDVAISLGPTDTVVITLTNPNTDGTGEKGSGMNVVSISVKWADPVTQTITSSIETPYTDEDVTLTTNATTASWEITANTAGASLSAASGKSITVSASQVGSVTVQATASGYTTASKTISFIERPVGTYYDVTFDSDGGSESPARLSIAEGETFEFPSPGTKEHYTFDGWTSDVVNFYDAGDTSPAVTSDIEYIACWTEDAKANVTYTAGANGSGSYVHANQYVGTYTLPEFASLSGISAADGYRFKNYTVNTVNKEPGETFDLTENTAVTVNFELIPLRYDVTFGTADGNAGLSNFNNTSYTIPAGVTLDNIDGYIYGKNDNTASAIRFGKSGDVGSFDVTINSNYFIKKIVANLKYYGSDTTAVFVVTPSGGESVSTTLTNSFVDYEFDISSSYTNKATLGTTINGKRAYLSGFSIIYGVKSARAEIENKLITQTKLSYHYEGNSVDGFEFSNLSIRFGGLLSQALWAELGQSNISGFGVMITARSSYSISEHANEAVLAESSPNISTQLVNYYMPTTGEGSMATPVAQSTNYIWNLFQAIDENDTDVVFSAAAYVKLDTEYAFFRQVEYSIETLAADYITNRNCDNQTAGGSLAILAAPALA